MVITNFHGEKIPKESVHYVCLPIITVDFVVKMDKKKLPPNIFRRM